MLFNSHSILKVNLLAITAKSSICNCLIGGDCARFFQRINTVGSRATTHQYRIPGLDTWLLNIPTSHPARLRVGQLGGPPLQKNRRTMAMLFQPHLVHVLPRARRPGMRRMSGVPAAVGMQAGAHGQIFGLGLLRNGHAERKRHQGFGRGANETSQALLVVVIVDGPVGGIGTYPLFLWHTALVVQQVMPSSEPGTMGRTLVPQNHLRHPREVA